MRNTRGRVATVAAAALAVVTGLLLAAPAGAATSHTASATVTSSQSATVTRSATATVTVQGITRTATKKATHTARAKATAKRSATAKSRSAARSKARQAALASAQRTAKSRATTTARSTAQKKAQAAAHTHARTMALAAVPDESAPTPTPSVPDPVGPAPEVPGPEVPGPEVPAPDGPVELPVQPPSGATPGETASPVELPDITPGVQPTEPTTDECGDTLRKADGTAWRCTLVEQFDGDTLDRSLWVPQRTDVTGWNNSEECVTDDPSTIDVSGGTLKIHTRKAAEPFTCKSPFGDFTSEYRTASISTWSKFTQAYGRFEFRAKMPDVKVPGIHSALWMWPENDQKYGPWPHSGEIDVAEIFTRHPDRAIPMLHYNGPMEGRSGAADSGRTNYYCVFDPSQWTTYVAEWTPTGITISYNGNVCLRHEWNALSPLSAGQPFDQPFMMAISQGLGVKGTGNQRVAETPALATMEVDWVKVWE